ncbi:hypothetical protein T4E_6458 [Trichinella pseudospiralis]|uniref:Uncharacterized protein n=1 Tax=Trichinella pseudospiralis TaxID=6337 RepID=A0A0V0Y8H4_TRIPS|nr:hypothetical protein T4E_6458 [Trichinella pseudospiralis]
MQASKPNELAGWLASRHACRLIISMRQADSSLNSTGKPQCCVASCPIWRLQQLTESIRDQRERERERERKSNVGIK